LGTVFSQTNAGNPTSGIGEAEGGCGAWFPRCHDSGRNVVNLGDCRNCDDDTLKALAAGRSPPRPQCVTRSPGRALTRSTLCGTNVDSGWAHTRPAVRLYASCTVRSVVSAPCCRRVVNHRNSVRGVWRGCGVDVCVLTNISRRDSWQTLENSTTPPSASPMPGCRSWPHVLVYDLNRSPSNGFSQLSTFPSSSDSLISPPPFPAQIASSPAHQIVRLRVPIPFQEDRRRSANGRPWNNAFFFQ